MKFVNFQILLNEQIINEAAYFRSQEQLLQPIHSRRSDKSEKDKYKKFEIIEKTSIVRDNKGKYYIAKKIYLND